MTTHSVLLALVVAVACLTSAVHSFGYLPGIAPHEYSKDASIPMFVNKLTSTHTQLPFDFYDLPFCNHDDLGLSKEFERENLGQVLAGDSIESSVYSLKMRKNEVCKILCRKVYSAGELAEFRSKIDDDYRIDWIVDNMPVAQKYLELVQIGEDAPIQEDKYDMGYRVGFTGAEVLAQAGQARPDVARGEHYIYNHVRLRILTHAESDTFRGWRIVGFEVEPYSVKHTYQGDWRDQKTELQTCNAFRIVGQKGQTEGRLQTLSGDKQEIIWTYDVHFQDSDVKWASRWDMYLKTGSGDSQIHWFSVINSVVISLFLTGMVALILMRALHKDLAAYNALSMDDDDDAETGGLSDETGWKLVHGDVFRAPKHPQAFAVAIGTGIQVLLMTTATLFFALLGFLSPARRGGLMTALLLLFVLMAGGGGYASSRMCQVLGISDWRRVMIWTALLYPAINFCVFFVLNLFVWNAGSTSAVPFTTMLSMLVMWFGISVPLAYLGAYTASKQPSDALKPVVKVNLIPRQIPEQPWYLNSAFTCVVGGLLPFGAVFMELFFIMSAVWMDHVYYLFDFLFVVFIILIITCAEIAIVLCYFQLLSEDYAWWWRSFVTSGSSAGYLFVYAGTYYFSRLPITSFVPTILYFGYMSLISLAFFLVTGTVGSLACFLFTRKIFSEVKID